MTKTKMIIEQKEWDKYWTKKKTKSQAVYRIIASLYRQLIIKRALNHFIEKEFAKNSSLLHAGSGGGQVDEDLLKNYKITALDISKEALKLYKFYNGNKAKLIQASIFDIPVKASSFDGIYNLGVHEHFTQKENEKILKEFSRILKPNGKIVLFWPPKFGTSVIFLNSLHFILNNVLGKKIRLHPEEISLVKSKHEIQSFLKRGGFKLKEFYFGPLDMFTHCIVVAKKT
ncbi:MAG: methyltransferase domain-containing protein [Patescibacteria group bacterium]